MSLCYIRGILSSTMPAFNIVIVIRGRRRWQIRQLSSFGLKSLHLPHHFHCVLQFLVLNLPFCFLLLAKVGLHIEFRLLLHFYFFLRLYLHSIAFADFLVLSNSIWIELSPTSSACNQVAAFSLILLWNFEVVPSASFGCNRFFFLYSLPKWSLIYIRLSDHGMLHASFLMWHQRFLIESPTTVLALNKCLLHEGIERFCVELVYIILGDFSLRGELLKTFRSFGARASLLGRFQVLLVLPLFLAGFDVDGKAVRAESKWKKRYQRPQMQQTNATGRFIGLLKIIN